MKPNFEILAEVAALSEEKAGFGAVETRRGRLPLKAMDLSGRITGLQFRNRLSQTFVNAYAEPLEATYIFPLPDRAAVVSFKMRVADRLIEGVLKEREEAREEYSMAIASGYRAAIAEEERGDVFTMRAGNLMPGDEMTVELELSGPLEFADGEATYRFPLVVAPRYIPGVPLDGASVGSGTAVDTDQVPDASRITPPLLLPGQPNPVFLTLSLELDPAGLPVQRLRASLHDLQVEELAGGVRRVSLQPGATRLDRDFILRFQAGEESVVSTLRYLPDPEGGEGTFALTIVPPTLQQCRQSPRDVVVVLDRSGSMEGWKMVAARRAAARIVDSLTTHDRFAVLLFDTVLEEPFDTSGKLVEASDRNRFKAVEFLAKVEARGGTEIGPALARSLSYFKSAEPNGRERVVVFVTDGQVGNEAQVLEHALGHAGPARVRIHTVGIDRSVNVAFLRDLAGQTGGMFDLVESEERLDDVLQMIHRRVGNPVLRDVKVVFAGQVATQLTPERADVFPGVPVVLSGRLRGEIPAYAYVEARQADGQGWQQKLTMDQVSEPVLRHVWARARVAAMQNQLDAGQGFGSLSEELTRFSLQWNVLSRFTAFVAVDRSQVVNRSGEVHQVTQAVEMPSGWAQAKQEAPAAALSRMKMAAPGGRAAAAPVMRARGGAPGSPPPPPLSPGPTQAGGWLGGDAASLCRDMMSEQARPAPKAPPEPDTKKRKQALPEKAVAQASPLETLRQMLPQLEQLVTSAKKGGDVSETVLTAVCELLRLLARSQATQEPLDLATRGQEALRAYRADATDGAKKLEAWVGELYTLAGVKRRKSWWKR